MIFFVAPTEATMGDVQRIVYLHVSVAWCGLAGCLAMGFCGAMFLSAAGWSGTSGRKQRAKSAGCARR